MFKLFAHFKKNIFLKRIYSIKKSIITYSLASFSDIFMILFISEIFNKLTTGSSYTNIFFNVMVGMVFIAFRTILVFLMRKYAFSRIFYKKIRDEKLLVDYFIKKRIKNILNIENDLNLFKEKLVNSSNLAVVNFDIPIVVVFSELIFAIGGIIILLKIFGWRLLLFNLPIFIVLLFFSKFVSKKLNILGKNFLNYTEKRLNAIDNVSEIAFELSALNRTENLLGYFEKVNKPFNKILNEQIITSNMMQIFTESTSFIIILISLICLVTNITDTSLANTATSLAVLSRLVPSFTRSISFITQLQFGVPSVKRLSQMKKI